MLKVIQSVKLLLRAVRALERGADALCDLRDHVCGAAGVAINRDIDDRADPEGLDISYSDDASTYERELASTRRKERYGTGSSGPWSV